jgi:hypothetical protein
MSANQADQMKGIGMPILFTVLLGASAFVSRQLIIDSFNASRGNMNMLFSFLCAGITAALSLFLYWSPAYNYGLGGTVVAYLTMCVKGGESAKEFSKLLLGITLVWFMLLIGIPGGFSQGIINAVSTNQCNSFYNTYQETMCKPGWLVFVQICSCVQIGLTLVSLLFAVSAVVGSEGSESAYKPIVGDNYQPPRVTREPGGEPQGAYHKVV